MDFLCTHLMLRHFCAISCLLFLTPLLSHAQAPELYSALEDYLRTQTKGDVYKRQVKALPAIWKTLNTLMILILVLRKSMS